MEFIILVSIIFFINEEWLVFYVNGIIKELNEL